MRTEYATLETGDRRADAWTQVFNISAGAFFVVAALVLLLPKHHTHNNPVSIKQAVQKEVTTQAKTLTTSSTTKSVKPVAKEVHSKAQVVAATTKEIKQYVNPALLGSEHFLTKGANMTGRESALESGEVKLFMHISDTHYDPFFDPSESMGGAICHSCKFSTDVYGEQAYCPTHIPDQEAVLEATDYSFGRYGCNPPLRLIHSLYHAMQEIDKKPEFVVLTGDIAPHGYPGDKAKVTKESKLADLCPSKLLVMRKWAQNWRAHFPNTKLIFTLGNNDHFPKNKYWQPFITALGDMFLEEGVFTKEEHEMFTQYGSVYYDTGSIRHLAIDFSLFTPGGELSFVDKKELKGLDDAEVEAKLYPVRHRTVHWVEGVLKEAAKKGKSVYIIGHQPMTTKKGKDELDVEGVHYGKLKNLFADYAGIIKIGLFGHRNLAAIQPIQSPLGLPIIPSITVPGVSPRGKNHPSFNVMFYQKDGVVTDFEQWVFNLGEENQMAKGKGNNYMGSWRMHHRDMYSWAAFSGGLPFTATSLMKTLDYTLKNEKQFFAIELWKRGGYIGDETPENYKCKALFDTNEGMMHCLFPKQDERCWDKGWLA